MVDLIIDLAIYYIIACACFRDYISPGVQNLTVKNKISKDKLKYMESMFCVLVALDYW